jgi:N-acetylneuraminic acid mutarotase
MQTRQRYVYRTLSVVVLMIVALLVMASISWAQWIEKSPMPTPRWGHSASVVNGKIYLVGGADEAGNPLPTVEEYDPVTDTWTEKAPMPTARVTATSVVDGKIYAIGGSESVYTGWETFFLEAASTVEEYDPVTDTWITGKAPMPTARWCHSASAVDGVIYAMGGAMTGRLNFDNLLSTVEAYIPETDTWITGKADMPTIAAIFSTEEVNGKIYACGVGWGNAGGSLDAVHEYDPVTDTWTTKAHTPMDGLHAPSACEVNGRIYLIGGTTGGFITLPTVFEYDPATDRWDEKTSMPPERGGWFKSTSVVDGVIYAFGGCIHDNTTFVSTVHAYDPALDITSIEALFWGALKATFR